MELQGEPGVFVHVLCVAVCIVCVVVRVGRAVQQQPGDLEMAVLGSPHQRGVSMVGSCLVWVGRAVPQQSGHIEVAVLGGFYERGVSNVSACLVRVGLQLRLLLGAPEPRSARRGKLGFDRCDLGAGRGEAGQQRAARSGPTAHGWWTTRFYVGKCQRKATNQQRRRSCPETGRLAGSRDHSRATVFPTPRPEQVAGCAEAARLGAVV